MDTFKISWRAYNQIDTKYKHYVDTVWEFHRTKGDDESLKDFFKENTNKAILPKYILNDLDIAWWLNKHGFEEKLIDTPGFYINSLYVAYPGFFKSSPSLRLTIFELFGNKVNFDILKKLGFDVDKKVEKWDEKTTAKMEKAGITPESLMPNWDKFVAEENESVLLYCCGCGDRGCPYIGVDVKKEGATITWDICLDTFNTYRFDYHQYREEFQEFLDLINFQPESVYE